MPRSEPPQSELPMHLVYSPKARAFHWITVACVAALLVLGEVMTYRGNTLNVWDGLTNGLYSAHKLERVVS
jgi:cytochrome b561